MLELFKEVTHPYNLENSSICGSYKIELCVIVEKPLPTLVQKSIYLSQTK